MTTIEKRILDNFKSRVTERIKVYRMLLFGSRARGDSSPASDMDVLIVTEGPVTDKDADHISDCAWEAGFERGIVVVPIAVSRDEWENGPERHSLLARAVEMDGVPV